MAVVKVPPGKLGVLIKSRTSRNPAAIMKGLEAAANRGRGVLTEAMPVYKGHLKNAWDVLKPGPREVALYNDAPYAGIIERGARPHSVSPEGFAAIREWVRIKIGGSDAEIDSITHAIVWKFRQVGRRGDFPVRKSMKVLRAIAAKEVVKALHAHNSAPYGSGGHP